MTQVTSTTTSSTTTTTVTDPTTTIATTSVTATTTRFSGSPTGNFYMLNQQSLMYAEIEGAGANIVFDTDATHAQQFNIQYLLYTAGDGAVIELPMNATATATEEESFSTEVAAFGKASNQNSNKIKIRMEFLEGRRKRQG